MERKRSNYIKFQKLKLKKKQGKFIESASSPKRIGHLMSEMGERRSVWTNIRGHQA